MGQSQELESIFSQAMQLSDAAARRTYVEQACGGDAQLAQQVFSLLKAARESEGFLESPVRRSAPAHDSAHDSEQPTSNLQLPAQSKEFPFLSAPIAAGDLGSLGPYRILDRVGRGGMGIVFRAFDEELQRIVAVKVLAPEIAIDPMARKRFEREARSAAAINHPHVVVIHAVDQTHNPPYLVMEFVQGKTLADKLASQGALTVKEILRIGGQVAEGLAAAHKQGLVHRDIKPANILLENGVERAKVSDFGLAKAVADVAMTRTGDLSGTPQYMSPEQASGGRVDHRTDLFSLGAILYLMCTGRPPFRADNALAVLKRICEETPRPIERLNPEIPGWLSEIVDRLLAKSPADRYQTATEVAVLLQQHLATLQGGASITRSFGSIPSGSAGKLLRRWRWPLLASGLLMGTGFLIWLASGPRPLYSSSGQVSTNGPAQFAPANEMPKNDKTGLAIPTSRGAAKRTPPGPDSTERNQTLDPLDGIEAGERREFTNHKIAFHWCPPGQFLMGNPQSEVERGEIDNQFEMLVPHGFWMQETEVTQSEWERVMGSLPSREMRKGKGEQHPIYYVSLEEAMTFCRKLTDVEREAGRLPADKAYRLPTDAQWEYACRAGTTTATAFGDQLSSTQANFGGDWPHNGAPQGPSHNQSVKVRSYRPNAWGIYDMHGNVKEFTTTPGRVRGGSWFDSGRNCCSGIWIPDPPSASENVGFRMVLTSVP